MRLQWAATGYGTHGLDRGVLYLADGTGVPWNGLTGATESAEDKIQTDLYFDGVRFAFAQSGDDFGLSVEMWTYPPELEDYIGEGDILTKQVRKPFGFCYRVDMNGFYEIHLVWNVTGVPFEKPYSSKNNELEISLFQMEMVTKPKIIEGIKPTAHFVVNTELAPEEAVEALENILYGTDLTDPSFPQPQEVIDLFLDFAVLVVVNHGDGTWTATGPDDVVTMLDAETFQIKWPSVQYITSEKYKVSSM